MVSVNRHSTRLSSDKTAVNTRTSSRARTAAESPVTIFLFFLISFDTRTKIPAKIGITTGNSNFIYPFPSLIKHHKPLSYSVYNGLGKHSQNHIQHKKAQDSQTKVPGRFGPSGMFKNLMSLRRHCRPV